jgi:hypothetical protein
MDKVPFQMRSRCAADAERYALTIVSAILATSCSIPAHEQALFDACFIDQSEGWEILAKPPSNRDELLSKESPFTGRREKFREAWFGIGVNQLAVCAYRNHSRGCKDVGDYMIFRRVKSGWEQGDGSGLDHIILCDPIRRRIGRRR